MLRAPLLAIPLCLLAALAFGTVSPAYDPKKPEAPHSMAGHGAGSMELHRIMSQGHSMPMPISGNVDRDFAAMMTMHHQQAIKMSDVRLLHGTKSDELHVVRA